jgi:CRP-like cAMP-binding protein
MPDHDDARPALHLFLARLLSRSRLDGAAQQAILDLPGAVSRIRRNENCADSATRSGHACLVTDGLAARWGQTLDGQRQITAFHLPGDMPDLQALVLSGTTLGLQALSPVTILRVPHAALRNIAANPQIAEAFWRDCAADAAMATEWVINLGRRKARTRIAHLICEVATRLGKCANQNTFVFDLPITQTHIADATGLSTVHVNRSLQDLKKSALAELAGHEVRVMDWPSLRAAADFNPAYLHLGNGRAP